MPPSPTAPRTPVTRSPLLALLLVVLVTFGWPASPEAQGFEQKGSHQHGVALLDVAVDGNDVTLRLTVPALHVVGYERAARNDAERKAAAAAAARLEDHRQVFAFPVAARCRVATAMLEVPEAGGHEGHDHDHDHDHGGSDEHADYVGTYAFRCDAPAALRFIEARVLSVLVGNPTLRANVATARGQSQATLSAATPRLTLP